MSPPVAPPTVKRVGALHCPNCGGRVELRGFGTAINAVCGSCNSVLSTDNHSVQILQKFEVAIKHQPLIELGKRGKLRGESWEAIGFQRREVVSDGVAYPWSEYLLFNPYRGYRYLIEYQGHWSLVRAANVALSPGSGDWPKVEFDGRTYRKFSTGEASTTFVLGEFPFEVRFGDVAQVQDFTLPPYSLSREEVPGEVTWSTGEYLENTEVWRAFQLPGEPPKPSGVYFNQPNPYYAKHREAWKTFGLMMIAWLLVTLGVIFFSPNETPFDKQFLFDPATSGEKSFVTDSFQLKGHNSNAEVQVESNPSNQDLDVDVALINEETGDAYNGTAETSFYSGVDQGESWTEGDRSKTLDFNDVPPGKYYLRLEPSVSGVLGAVPYSVKVRHGAPGALWMILAMGLLLLPPIFYSILWSGFETSRWQQSDLTGGSDEDDEEDE
jgi:hypothetical protein